MWAQIVGMALSVVGGVRGSFAAGNAADVEEALLAEQSVQVSDEARVQAKMIRKMGQVQTGQTKGAIVKAGLDVNSSTASDMVDAVDGAVEQDAMMALLTGERKARALRNQASIANSAGKEAATQSILGGASSAMGSFGGMGGGK